MRHVVGFSGPIEVGKTTMAEYLEFEYGHRLLSYGTPLKEALSAATGLPMEVFTDQKLKKQIISWLGITPRDLMQKFATDFIRDMIHPDFFVLRVQQDLENKYPDSPIVIDDVRFPNEANFIRSLGGTIIHLHRDSQVIDEIAGQHKSEKHKLFQEGDVLLELPEGITNARAVLQRETERYIDPQWLRH